MRFAFILLLLSHVPGIMAQEVKLSVECQDSWPPGKPVPVTVTIDRGTTGEFARFFQDLPQGFSVEAVESSGADFYWDNNQVNFVWVKLPPVPVVRVQYLVKPDAALSGSFRLGGRLDYIDGGSERRSVEIQPLLIRLDRKARVEDAAKVESLPVTITGEGAGESKTGTENVVPAKVKVDFRVQVAIASLRLLKEELESRIGCALRYDIITLKSGNMYKYQSGSFRKYDEAEAYLSELKDCGVKDAFIVAYKDGEQISIEMARSLTE
jgi:hypothetical protein